MERYLICERLKGRSEGNFSLVWAIVKMDLLEVLDGSGRPKRRGIVPVIERDRRESLSGEGVGAGTEKIFDEKWGESNFVTVLQSSYKSNVEMVAAEMLNSRPIIFRVLAHHPELGMSGPNIGELVKEAEDGGLGLDEKFIEAFLFSLNKTIEWEISTLRRAAMKTLKYFRGFSFAPYRGYRQQWPPPRGVERRDYVGSF